MEKLVFRQEKEPMTSSWLVAKKFGKDHRHVMRDIRNLIEGMSKIEHTPCKFIESTYVHPQNGVTYPLYIMNQEAFSLLVMGFTGQTALQFKIDFINQFNTMRDYILKGSQQNSLAITPEQEAKMRYADALIEADVPCSLKGVASKIMLTNGKKMTRPQLVSWLFDNGFMKKDPNILYCPTEWALDMGYIMIKVGSKQIRKDRVPKNRPDKGIITPLGAMYIINLLSHSLPVPKSKNGSEIAIK